MPIKILALGDIMPGENHYHYNRGIRTYHGNNYNNLIGGKIKTALFDDVDAVIYNFEYSLSFNASDFKNIDSSVYSTNLMSLDILPKNLLKIANIANNHFSEHGASRVTYTKKHLTEKGVCLVGENSKPKAIQIKGKELLVWGVTLVPDKDNTGMYFKSTYQNLTDDIELPALKKENQYWILSIHWGTEYIHLPDKEQVNLANKLISLGFDIIHGHHPHVYQPVEYKRNSLVIYSCGNFIFDQNFSNRTRVGLALKASLYNGKVEVYEMYKVESRKYQPKKIKRVQLEQLAYNEAIVSSQVKKLVKVYYRFLMKLELVYNFAKVDNQTKRYLFNKAIKSLRK